MIRRVMYAAFAVALISGCEKPPVSTNPDVPTKTVEGVDKKGRKTKSMDVSLEDPTAKK